MKLNAYQKACLAFFLVLVVFWIALAVDGSKTGFYNYLYSFLYGVLPLAAGLASIKGCRVFGGFSNAIGKAIFFIGMGLFFFGVGETIWSYYNIFLGVEAPYPSFADLFFAPSEFFYTIGVIYLAQTTGTRLGLTKPFGKAFAIFAPLALLALSYYVLVVWGHGGSLSSETGPTLKAFLDFVYPLGDFVALTVAVLITGLSFRYLGGEHKPDIVFILAGLAVLFIADSYFSYATTVEIFYNGGLCDLVFTVGLFFLSFGVLGFNTVKNLTPQQGV